MAEFKKGRDQLKYQIVEERLNTLIAAFGGTPSSHYPFFRLQNDGIWIVEGEAWVRNASGEVSVSQLRERNAIGRFTDPILNWLRLDPQNVAIAASAVIAKYFPEWNQRRSSSGVP